MRPFLRLLLIGCFVPVVATPPLQAQFGKKLTERVKQNAAVRKQQTEENILARAAEPADSAMERIAAPVDSAAAKAGGKAGQAVSQVGRGPAAAEEARIREELAAGRADLMAVGFEAGGDAITPGSDPSLTALAKVIAGSPGTFLVQARADAGLPPAQGRRLADARAAALKAWLLAHGVPGERLFTAGDGSAVPGGPLASALQMQ